MGNKETLKIEYTKALNELINGFRQKSVELRKSGANDEAIFEQIKANVGNIFLQMFNVSFNTVFNDKNTEKFKKYMDENKTQYDQLHDVYLSFFESIPEQWKVSAKKDKEHEMDEEYHKEQIKLSTAEEIRKLFTSFHEKYKE